MVRTTARALGTLPGRGSSRGHEDRDRCLWPERRPPIGSQQASAVPLTTACNRAVGPRSPYERSCHRCVVIILSGHRITAILKVAATRRWPADRGREYLLNASFGMHTLAREIGHRTPPRAGRKDEINVSW